MKRHTNGWMETRNLEVIDGILLLLLVKLFLPLKSIYDLVILGIQNELNWFFKLKKNWLWSLFRTS